MPYRIVPSLIYECDNCYPAVVMKHCSDAAKGYLYICPECQAKKIIPFPCNTNIEKLNLADFTELYNSVFTTLSQNNTHNQPLLINILHCDLYTAKLLFRILKSGLHTARLINMQYGLRSNDSDTIDILEDIVIAMHKMGFAENDSDLPVVRLIQDKSVKFLTKKHTRNAKPKKNNPGS